ncbi:sphingomyelin phosphodiesterase 4, neutral membrane (neutral sphingomyelinase-3) [Podila verticillata]|nr:sphingomyelin phosphodiesterase 4, neutral membrane (neutral sphingomyelinase-3) [Podila verticillata]
MSFELDRLLVGSVPMACNNLANHLQQCAESDAHAKSFYEFLPRLCQIFFGSRESRGWLHLPLSKAEADRLFDLLKPGGLLFRFLVNRSTDTGFIYEMNPESLPKSTQSKLDPAHYMSLPPIYLSRVSLVKTTTTIDAQKTVALVSKVNINFNMLEYFLFYFAYALTLDDDEDNNRMLKRPEPKMAFRIQGLAPSTPSQSSGYQQPNWNARAAPKPMFPRLVHGPYFNLYEEYLKYFLPEPEKSGLQQTKEKPFSIFSDASIENSVNRQQTQLAITEFFIGTTVELWLGQNDSNVNNMTIRYVQPGTSLTACINDLVSHLLSYDISQYRHGGEVAPTHVAALARRSAYQVVRPKLYTFVRSGLKFWPLDETFPRLVDLWVTWITPWHYGRRDSLLAKDAVVVKEQWQPYIFENLLFYTTLLQLFLPRLSQPTQSNRSLTAPAPMPPTRELRQLRKVLNVYKAEHLKHILKVAEQVVLSPEQFTESTFHMFDSETGRDATSAFLSSMAVSMPTLMYQLEGPEFRYQALFLAEGLGRTTVRQILTKLGNDVNTRQGKLTAIQAKNKPSAAQNSIFDKLSAMFESSAPKIASSKEIDTLTSESTNLRETMKDVGNVFDLFQEFVESFERKQESNQAGGSALSAEQIEALIAPVEEDGSSLFSSVRQRRYAPQGLVRKSIDDIPVQGSRDSIILSYENEQLVKWTTQAEAYLNKRLPFKVPLRWLASYHNLACLGVIILAFVVVSMLMSFWSHLGDSHLQQPQQPHISKTAQTQDHNIVGHYDAHVQPVYKWERPDQSTRAGPGRQEHRQRSATVVAQPQYTIELEGI